MSLILEEAIALAIAFIIIEGVGIMLLREFIISKDGELRKLMIWYWAIDLWVYLVIYAMNINNEGLLGYLLIASIPKALIKIRLFIYLRKLNKNRHTLK